MSAEPEPTVSVEELRHLPIESAAHYYCSHGLAIVPLVGKNPCAYGADWWSRAITDPAEAVAVFASDSRWTNIGWAQGYGTVAIDVDHPAALSPELREVCKQGALNPTRPGRGHRVFATDGHWSASTGRFPVQGWGEVRACGGQVVIWGPHPDVEGHRYCYDPHQPIPAAPARLTEWLTGRGSYETTATDAEAVAWSSDHTEDRTPRKLHGVAEKAGRYLDEGIGIHETFVKIAPWVAREVTAGHYSAERARAWMDEAWERAWRDRQGEDGRQLPNRGELDGIWRWAIAQSVVEEPGDSEAATPVAEVTLETSEDDDPDASLYRSRIDWPTFWATDHTSSDWLVEPLLAAGRLHSITSAPKVGKSLLALHMAAAAATGRSVLGLPAQRRLRVLYIDQEMGPADLQERLVDMGYGPDDDMEELHYFQLTPLLPMNTKDGAGQLIRMVQQIAPDLVVIDTLSRVVQGDENDALTYHDLYRLAFQPVRALGAAVLRLDHAGHENIRARGSSAKATDVDVAWFLTAAEDGGLVLKATHRRLGWVPERVEVARSDAPLEFSILAGMTWPAGTKDLAADLDRLGVPIDAGRPAARKILTDAGVPARNEVLSAALRYRRERSLLVVADDHTEWDSCPQNPGTAPKLSPRDSTGDSIQEPSNTKGDSPGDSSGQLPEGSGDTPLSLTRDRGGPSLSPIDPTDDTEYEF